jgi:SAM-dependent methyltransferase
MCHLSFPLIEGIPVFAECWDSAFGIMAPSEVKDLVRFCKAKGWDKGVAAFLGRKSVSEADSWAGYLSPETRAAGRLLLPSNPGARVLDLGCGIGPLSINFARHAKEVVGVDRGLAQLLLLSLRAREAGIGNLRLICAGDRKRLPFPEKSFDVVLLNGVLELVASTRKSGSPRSHRGIFCSRYTGYSSLKAKSILESKTGSPSHICQAEPMSIHISGS